MIFLTASLVFVLDRLTKLMVIHRLVQGESLKILPDIFHITLVLNDGTAFGLFKGWNAFFVFISSAIIILIVSYALLHKFSGAVLSLALGLILGGAIGNLVDRLKLGYVIDFLDFRIWPVFNLADSSITIGMMVLAWKILSKKVKVKR